VLAWNDAAAAVDVVAAVVVAAPCTVALAALETLVPDTYSPRGKNLKHVA